MLVVTAACSDDGGRPDDRDAPSAAPMPCGPNGLTCDPDTQICVIQTPVGPGMNFVCLSVPSGCASDRSCACAGSSLCTGAFATCGDRDEPNTIACECTQCQ